MTCNGHDVTVLRGLAREYAEIAAGAVQDERRGAWTALNSLKPARPTVLCSVNTGNNWAGKLVGEDGVWYTLTRAGTRRVQSPAVIRSKDGARSEDHTVSYQGWDIEDIMVSGAADWGAMVVTLNYETGPFELTATTVEFPERPELVSVPYCPTPIELDGDLSDWADVPPAPHASHSLKRSPFKLCWREDGLYAAAVFVDDAIEPLYSQRWRGDLWQVWLDREFGRGVSLGPHAFQVVLTPTPEDGPGPGHVRLSWSADEQNWTTMTDWQTDMYCAWAPTDDGYTMEFHVTPEAFEPSVLEAGTRIGLEMKTVNDGTMVDYMYSNPGHQRAWLCPASWAVAELAAPQDAAG